MGVLALVGSLVLAGCAPRPAARAFGCPPAEEWSKRNIPGPQFTREQGPFGTAVRLSLEEAVARSPYPLYRPHSPLASDSTICAVFSNEL